MTYEALTGEFVVNSTTAGLQRSPSVTYLVGGGYVVTWQDESGQGGDPTGSSVRGQVYDAGGTPVGGEFVVNSTTLGNQADPAVAATPDGGFVVTWYDDSGTGGDASSSAIKARMFGADGTPVADEFLVNTATANQQIQPSIAMLVDGRFVITWADASADSGDSPYGIKAQIFGTDGTPLGGEFHVNSETANYQIQPAIAALANGGFAITWMHATGVPGAEYDVRAQAYDSAGNQVGGEVIVNVNPTSGEAEPTIAGLTGGGFVVSWSAPANGDFSVYGDQARVFDASGNAVTGEFLVNSQTSGEQSQGVVTGLADGTFVIAFVDGYPGYSYQIKAQQFAADGTKLGDEIQVNSQYSGQIRPSITTLESGHFVISWMNGFSSDVEARIYDGPAPITADAQNDEFTTNELGIVTGNVFADNGFGPDSGGPLIIIAVNGVAADVGNEITLPSGALLTLNADGSFTYDPNGSFEYTPTAGSGAVNTPSADAFSYTLAGGDSATVVVTINGVDNNDVLLGDDNNNVLTAGAGNDLLFGFDGNDFLRGNFGNDYLDGGDGFDRIGYFNGSTSGVTVDLRITTAQNVGEQGFDTITNVEAVSGTIFADTLTGDDNNNWLWGSISGGGTTNNDTIDGQGGDDLIEVGAGNHSLTGGSGVDTLQYSENGGPEVGISVALWEDLAQNTGAGTWTLSGFENLFGGTGDDSLEGDDFDNIIGGSLGADLLFGYGGNDTLYGDGYVATVNNVPTFFEDSGTEGGNDQLFGGAGNDILYGGGGNDSLRGANGNDTLYGGSGNDFNNGGFGDDYIDGGDGFDRAGYYQTNESIGGVTVNLNVVGPQNTNQGWDTLVSIDYISGTPFADVLIGDGNDNVLWGSAATIDPATNWVSTSNNDTLDGGGGDDMLVVGIGNHSITGGTGTDTLVFTENFGNDPAVSINLALQGGPQDTGQGIWTINGVENLGGGDDNDTLAGDGGANVIAGNSGNDVLNGGGGNDILYGDGQFTNDGGSGPAVLITDNGSNGNDTLDGGAGNDQLFGGGGSDTASYASATGNVSVFLYDATYGEAYGANGFDQLYDIENLTGGAFNDVLYGNDEDNIVSGGDGHDDVRGLGGNDQIYGGAGDDLLYGNAGDDLIDGGAGFDRAGFFTGATAGVHVDLNLQGVAQDTGQGMDTLVSIENVSGTQFGDTLIGDGGDNVLWGSAATVSGVVSPDNNDTLIGNGGNDLLVVGIGNHTVDGGSGIDTFRFTENGVPETGITLSLLLAGQAQVTANGTWTLTGIENLSGSIAGDTLIGDGGDNVLAGDLGNDALIGGAGNDTLYGDGQIMWDGHGTGRSGPITTYADATGNYVGGVSGNDILEGGLGNDIINGGGGVDTASYEHASGAVTVTLFNNTTGNGNSSGADGNDTLNGIENLTGGAYNDALNGNALANVLTGGDGHDSLRGNGGDDTIFGGAGDDLVYGNFGNDYMDGGDGYDRAGFFTGATAGVHVDLNIVGAQDTGQGMDTLVNIEHVTGTSFADTLIGDGGNNWLGGQSDGTADTISGNGGNDLITDGSGDHILDGGSGVDTFAWNSGSATGGLTISLAAQGAAQNTGAGNMTLTGFENLSGSFSNDVLTGDGGNNVLGGEQGDDTLVGGAGNDALYGDGAFGVDTHGIGGSGPIAFYSDIQTLFPGAVGGTDTLEGGLGDDLLDGGNGIDTAVYSHASGAVQVDLGSGSAEGADGNDTLVNIENVIGSAFADEISGDGGSNTLDGGAGNDFIQGGAGNDTIYGGDGDDFLLGDYGENNISFTGNDILYGGNGNDGLRGGLGDDQLYGGSGNDLLRGNGGVDYFDGGTNNGADFNGIGDRVSFYERRATQGAVADLRTGIISNDGFGNIETMVGIESLGADTAYIDTFYGNDAANYLAASRGDYLYGFGGDDQFAIGAAAAVIDGGAGIDDLYLTTIGGWLTPDANNDGLAELAAAATSGWVVNLSTGAITDGYGNGGTVTGIENVWGSELGDTLIGDSGVNVLNGLDGNDIIEGRGGNDTIDGGNGIDTASYANASGSVNVDLGSGVASGADGNDVIANVENVTGSAFDDTLTGNAGDNALSGGDGADFVRGGDGNDSISGGNGNDILKGQLGNDIIDGGAGIDRAGYYHSDAVLGGVTVSLLLQGTAQNVGSLGWDTLIGIENVFGTPFADTLTGDANDNWLSGSEATISVGNVSGSNNDYLDGGAGNDLLSVGIGNHTIIGGTGSDTLWFTENGFPETGIVVSLALQGTAQATGNGSWTLTGIENLTGSVANDTLTGDGNANVLGGGAGSDTLIGGAGNDTLYGDGGIAVDGHDVITTFSDVAAIVPGGIGSDVAMMPGVDGNDTLEGGLGDDVIWGGGGADTASYVHASGSVTATLTAGGAGTSSGADGNDTLNGIENLTGGAYNDVLTGNGGVNTLDGGDGHDKLNGGAGNDTLLGGNGDDTLTGGTGDDVLNGGVGYDRAAYFGASAGVTVSLAIVGQQNTGGAGLDTLIGIENLTGTQYSDTLIGDANDNWLWGFATTAGTVNNDTLNGGAGNDLLWAGNGNMTLIGGTGNDTVMYNQNFSGDVAVNISLAIAGAQNTGQGTWTVTGIENLVGGTANDTLTGDGFNNILAGGAGTDTIDGGAGNDTIYGDGEITFDDHGTGGSGPIIIVPDAIATYGGVAGNDNLSGGDGDDFIYGGAGADVIKGDKGDDTLYGGAGNDTLTGGQGIDRYVIENVSGADTISGFAHLVDKIVFDDSSGVTSYAQLTLTKVGTNTLVTWGNGNSITLIGLKPADLSSADFQFNPAAAAYEHVNHSFATDYAAPHDIFV